MPTIRAWCRWSIGSGNVVRDDVYNAFISAGLDASVVPRSPTADVCIKRALEVLYGNRNTLVKPTKNGHAVLPRSADEKGEPLFRTAISVSQMPERCEYPSLDISGLDDMDQCQQIIDEYERQQTLLGSVELSAMMVNIVRYYVDGISLRERGQMYFVPSPKVEKWSSYSAILKEKAGIKVSNLPAMRVQEALDVLHSNVMREVQEGVNEIDAEINAWLKESAESQGKVRKIRTDAIEKRERELQRLLNMAEKYQKLLGSNMEDLTASVELAASRLYEAQMARM